MMLDNYKVPNKDLKVSLSQPIPNEDMSGQTASTETVGKGKKAKQLEVSLTVGFVDKQQLRELSALADAVDTKGDSVKYTIVDELAQAVNIRQVHFVGNFRVTKADMLQAWQISFSLAEYYSVPEKKEQRQPVAEPEQQASDTQAVAATDTEVTPEEPLTGFRKWLKNWDESLA